MNKLPTPSRSRILKMLCEGQSMRATARLANVSLNTVAKLLVDAGRVCSHLHDEKVRKATARRIQCDEIWSFTYAKQKNVALAKSAPNWAGDTWTWTAIDSDSKLIVSWLVGGRDGEYALALMDDLRSRLTHRVQLFTDGHKAYAEAVEEAFQGEIDYAQLVKIYGKPKGKTPEKRYNPSVCTESKRKRLSGKAKLVNISTSHVERLNLTLRMQMRRYTRLTNAFSKKFENHMHMVALYTVFYNFVRVHKSLRVTPAMEAGLTNKLWEIEDIIAAMDAVAPKPGPRGSYKKKISN